MFVKSQLKSQTGTAGNSQEQNIVNTAVNKWRKRLFPVFS